MQAKIRPRFGDPFLARPHAERRRGLACDPFLCHRPGRPRVLHGALDLSNSLRHGTWPKPRQLTPSPTNMGRTRPMRASFSLEVISVRQPWSSGVQVGATSTDVDSTSAKFNVYPENSRALSRCDEGRLQSIPAVISVFPLEAGHWRACATRRTRCSSRPKGLGKSEVVLIPCGVVMYRCGLHLFSPATLDHATPLG